MSTSDSCKDGSSTKSKEGVCDVNDKLQNMSTAAVSICPNCGKEGANNICNKCKQVRYCNAVCKKVHKKKHKKDCEELIRLATEKHNEELKRAAEKHDENLFKQPPPQYGDCPICFLRLPYLNTGKRYQSCCGKFICCGCGYAPVYDNQGNKVVEKKCPFCRTPFNYTDEETVLRNKKRLELDDPIALYNQGCEYDNGMNGYPQNHTKAIELWHRAGELGFANAYRNIAYAYAHGEGVVVDKNKAKHYWELSAIGGDATARHNLGSTEARAGNYDRALKHWMIAARDGFTTSLNHIQTMYFKGHATKDDYTTALRSYQTYLGEIKSKQRDEAAAADEDYRYYESGV